jgi:hypothetical protein
MLGGGTSGVPNVRGFNVVLYDPDGVDQQDAIITWTANALYETEIWRSLDGAAFALLTTVAPGTGTYTDELFDGETHAVEYYGRFKRDTTVLNAPNNLAINLVGAALRITWDDNNTEAEQIEIWSSIDSGAYNLVTTVNAGVETYDYTVSFTSTVDIKLRAKEGTLPVYSSYSDIENYTLTFDSDAATYFAVIAAEGGTLSVPHKILISNYVIAQKSAGIWAKTKTEHLLFNLKPTGVINLKSPAANKWTFFGNGNESNLIWTQDDGLVGNSMAQNTGYDSHFNPTSEGMSVWNMSIYWYCTVHGGGNLSSAGSYAIEIDTVSLLLALGGVGGLKLVSGCSFLGHCTIDNNSGTWKYFEDNVQKSTAGNSNTLLNETLPVMTKRAAGVAYSCCKDKLQIYSIREHLTDAERISDKTNKDTLLAGI